VREAGVNEGKRLKEYARNKFQGTDVDKTWAGIKKFVSSKEAGYSTEEIKTLNSLLNQGGTHGELALNEIAHRYESAISYSKEPQLLQGSGGTFSSFEPIDKRKYQAEIRELVNKFGEDSNEVRALRERRLMSIKQGY
jgi:hypothetical protein